MFNPPTVKDATDPDGQNQFTFVDSSENEQLRPSDFAQPINSRGSALNTNESQSKQRKLNTNSR